MHATADLAVLGLGNMGEAILRGLSRRNDGAARTIIAFDPSPERGTALSDLRGLAMADSAARAVAAAPVVLLAVKPQVMAEVLREIAPVAAGRLVVSIAAGIGTGFVESRLPGARVVRTMPNIPLIAGKGVVTLCLGASAGSGDVEVARRLFPGATVLEVKEELMDATTAVSGSGPAYFFAFVEALAVAAEAQGFERTTAYALAAGTFTGAAALLEQSAVDAAELRRRVTSPGGTTAAALKVFEEGELAGLVGRAVAAATRRGRELSRAAAQT